MLSRVFKWLGSSPIIVIAFKGGFPKFLDTYRLVSELVAGGSERATYGGLTGKLNKAS
jgi:hypothetical protein